MSSLFKTTSISRRIRCVSFSISLLLKRINSTSCRLSHWVRTRSLYIPSGVKCGCPSHSMASFASGQKKSKICGPSLCWRRNLAWQRFRLRTSCRSKHSAGVEARRRCLEKSVGACHLITTLQPPHPPTPSPPEEEKGRKKSHDLTRRIVILLPIERNKNVTAKSQCNTEFLTPQHKAQRRVRNREAPAVVYSLLMFPSPLNSKHFHDLIAEVINYLDCDAA